jgi:hypothetical protein
MGEMRNVYRIFVEKLKGKRPLERTGVGRRMILKRILMKQGLKLCTGFMWLRIGTSGEFL